MSNKLDVTSKSSCEKFRRTHTNATTGKTLSTSKKNNHKKCKSCSVNITSYTKPPIAKPKKTTKSEACFTPKMVQKRTNLDYCKQCGDVIGPVDITTVSSEDRSCLKPVHCSKHPTKTEAIKNSVKQNKGNENVKIYFKKGGKPQTVQEYYKNENFHQVSQSAQNINEFPRKISPLDTIKEIPEAAATEDASNSIFRIYSDGETEDLGYIDLENEETIHKLKEFRKENYFECHSAKSRITSKGSVISLPDHKCAYRFYLNDRLFPVPLHTDHYNEIRCVECHLPLKLDKTSNKNLNNALDGTIQAKVKLGSGESTQDMMLMLPVTEPLIIKQRRKERAAKIDKDVVYFGVIKLSPNGNSMFNTNLPIDSLALKYQKGYKEFDRDDGFKYESVEKGDVVII